MKPINIIFFIIITARSVYSVAAPNKTAILDNNPMSANTNKEFLNQMNSLIKSNKSPKSKFKSYLNISHNEIEDDKNEKLNEFLSLKKVQHLDEFNMMMIPEYRSIYKINFKILEATNQINDSNLIKIGVTSCNLNELFRGMKICSWHWILNERENVFPFIRPKARCNCENCQVDIKSECKPLFTLMPALVRESTIGGIEKWWFCLEEVPTSCACFY